MSVSITNIHMHIFNSECAPPNFLRVKAQKSIKKFARAIKWILEFETIRTNIILVNRLLSTLNRRDRRLIGRAISFLGAGAQTNQERIFQSSYSVARNYSTNPRLVALTLDMDFMDTNSRPVIPYATQLQEVMYIKQHYPDNIFPFICVDPRAKSGQSLVDWVQQYFQKGVYSKERREIVPYCSGIKLYPAHGFFPFDPRLDEMYDFAAKNGIPLMFHCTRGGSQYIGRDIEGLIPKMPEMIMPAKDNPHLEKAIFAREEIISRIGRYYQKGWIKNNKTGANDFACDLFSHPQNYIPVIIKYPDLKICFAHMGGTDEVRYMQNIIRNHQTVAAKKEQTEIWEADGYNWASEIKQLMIEYNNVYTDISSTIADLNDEIVLRNVVEWLDTPDSFGKILAYRILFGTDFYLTEIDKSEANLYEFLRNELSPWYYTITQQSINNYLKG